MRTETWTDPRCRMRCQASRQGDRSALESPASYIGGVVDEHGHPRLRCDCCGQVLSHTDADVNAVAKAAAQRLAPDAKATRVTEWECRVCGYTVQSLGEIRAKEDK